MGKWRVTLENGQVHDIEAPDEAQARAGMERMLSLPVIDPGNPVQAGVDVLRQAGDVVSRGGTDWLRSKLYGTTQEEQAKETEAARQRTGFGGALVEGTAAIAEPSLLGELQTGGRLAKTAWHGLEGGTQSMLDRWGHGERNPLELGKSFATGAGLTSAVSGLADAGASWFGRRQAREKQAGRSDLSKPRGNGCRQESEIRTGQASLAFPIHPVKPRNWLRTLRQDREHPRC